MCGPFNFLENQARSPRRSHTIFGLVCQHPPLFLRSPHPFDVLSAPTFPFLHVRSPRATPWAPQAGASPLPSLLLGSPAQAPSPGRQGPYRLILNTQHLQVGPTGGTIC